MISATWIQSEPWERTNSRVTTGREVLRGIDTLTMESHEVVSTWITPRKALLPDVEVDPTYWMDRTDTPHCGQLNRSTSTLSNSCVSVNSKLISVVTPVVSSVSS